MNLHEQCLLRYLTHPDELFYTTEILKLNNSILERKFIVKNLLSGFSGFEFIENAD